MNCAKCGAPLTGFEKFCSACGTPVDDPAAAGRALEGMGLYITAGPGVGRSFTLGEVTRIGRGSDNEVRLYDPEVSREHAAVYKYEQGFAVNDLGSANGTFLNGRRIEEAMWVRTGDEIRVGTVQLQVTAPGVPLARRQSTTPSGVYSGAGVRAGGGLPGWLLWALMGFGVLLTAAGVVGLVFMFGG